jgi:tRNA dimethylallyltransferase
VWIFEGSKPEFNLPNKKYLILVVGPTAVGKTELCIKLAKKFNTEIISSDSRQFYREMNLGTAKPSTEELAMVKHHMINTLSVEDEYDVKKFEEEAIQLLEKLFENKNEVIMTGGSGLFSDAVVKGLDDIPEIHLEIRDQVIKDYEKHGLTWLQEQIKQGDPEYFEQVDRQNPQRLMRALEIIRGTGQKFSSFRVRKKIERNFQTIKIGLTRDREELYARIDLRMDQMIENGLFEEAANFFDSRHLNALQTVGYSEIFGYLEGKYDREEAVRLLKRNSRRYAKRQLTWFRRDEEIKWFHPEQSDEIILWVENQIG